MRDGNAAKRDQHVRFEQKQCTTLEIEKILDAAMATSATESPQDHFSLIEVAHDRDADLDRALDPVFLEGLMAHEIAITSN